MALSMDEQRILAEIERRLAADDPYLAGNLSAFGFAQFPVYSDLVGYQLFPRYTFSVGASYAF